MRVFLASTLIAVIAISGTTQSSPTSTTATTAAVAAKPPKIEVRHSDSMEYNGDAHTVEMVGSVHVVRGTMSIKADRVDILMGDDEKSVIKAIATGHVEIVDGERKAVSNRAEYIDDTWDIILTGNPKLWNGDNEIQADKIIYNMQARTMKAAGRVRGILIPGGTF